MDFILGTAFTAIFVFFQASPSKAGSAREYLNRGNEASQNGQYAEAAQYFSQAIEINPDNGLSYINRGISFAKQGL